MGRLFACLFAAVLHGHGGAEHLCRVGAGQGVRVARGHGQHAAGGEIGRGLAGPGGHGAVKCRGGHVRGAQDVVKHDRSLLYGDGVLGVEHGAAVGLCAAYDAVHQRRGDVALLPDGDSRVVGKARGRYGGQQLLAAELHAHGQKLAARDLAVGLTDVAPAQLLAELYREDNGKNTDAVYPDHEQLLQDIAAAYRTVIRDLYNAGCRSIQFDDCTWGMFCDPNYQAFIAQAGVKLEDQANEYLRLNNLALEGRPADLALTTHVCRGNYHSTWASRGGYAPIAPILFAHENVDAFYLEFDDERSGNFEPLQYVAEGKKVVLGLITTKSPRLEDKAAVIARIHEAEKYIPLDRLCLSPQCGFASCEIGNKLTDLEQWNKLKLVKEIAEEVWGK